MRRADEPMTQSPNALAVVPFSAPIHRPGFRVGVVSDFGCTSGIERAVFAGLPGFSTSVSGRALVGRVGRCSGGCRGRVRGDGVVEQVGEVVFPGPVTGQVQPQAARGAGDACRDRDELGPDGGGGGLGVER